MQIIKADSLDLYLYNYLDLDLNFHSLLCPRYIDLKLKIAGSLNMEFRSRSSLVTKLVIIKL